MKEKPWRTAFTSKRAWTRIIIQDGYQCSTASEDVNTTKRAETRNRNYPLCVKKFPLQHPHWYQVQLTVQHLTAAKVAVMPSYWKMAEQWLLMLDFPLELATLWLPAIKNDKRKEVIIISKSKKYWTFRNRKKIRLRWSIYGHKSLNMAQVCCYYGTLP